MTNAIRYITIRVGFNIFIENDIKTQLYTGDISILTICIFHISYLYILPLLSQFLFPSNLFILYPTAVSYFVWLKNSSKRFTTVKRFIIKANRNASETISRTPLALDRRSMTDTRIAVTLNQSKSIVAFIYENLG